MTWVRAWRLDLSPAIEPDLAAWLASHLQAFAPPADLPVIVRIEPAPAPVRPATIEAFADLAMMGVPMQAWRLRRPHGPADSLTPTLPGLPAIDLDPADQALLVESAQGWATWQVDSAGSANIRYGGKEPSVPLLTLATEAFRLHGWFQMHASASVPAGSDPAQRRAALYLGVSGAGKSFRLLSDIRAGRAPLGEDRVWIRSDDLLVVARDDCIRLFPDALTHFGFLQGKPARNDPDDKRRYLYSSLGVRPALPATVGLACRPRGKDPDRLEAACLMWQSIGRPFTVLGRQRAETLASSLLRRTRTG